MKRFKIKDTETGETNEMSESQLERFILSFPPDFRLQFEVTEIDNYGNSTNIMNGDAFLKVNKSKRSLYVQTGR